MASLLRCALLLSLVVVAHADVALDDPYEKVIAAKGQPSGTMKAGDTVVLRYADQTIRLKAGKVAAVESSKVTSTVKRSASKSDPQGETRPVAAGGAATWQTDLTSAMADAKLLNRPIFLFFTGSDWCGWCMKLKQEVLSTTEFAAYAGENLILMDVDFPRSKAQSDKLKRQNEALAKKYDVRGFPTVIVIDRNGDPIGRLGYAPGGSAPFIQRLKSL